MRHKSLCLCECMFFKGKSVCVCAGAWHMCERQLIEAVIELSYCSWRIKVSVQGERDSRLEKRADQSRDQSRVESRIE